MSAEMKKLGQDLIDRGFRKAGKNLIYQAGLLEAAGEIPAALNETESRVDPINPLTQVLEELFEAHTPELYTATFQVIWQARAEQLREGGALPDLSVTPCPYTQEEIEQLEAEGRRLGYLPGDLSAQQNRYLIGELWPEMGSYSVEKDNPVTNEVDRYGWFNYEAAIDAPYLDTKEQQLRHEADRQGRLGMNLNEYIVASQDSKLLTGEYLDQDRTWVRLLGSRFGGLVVHACFGPDDLYVYSHLGPQAHGESLGGRLVGAPKAA